VAWAGVRHGDLAAGDWVRLTDAKGRRHNIRLGAGEQFFTSKGSIEHDDLIGGPEGVVVTSSKGTQYLAFRPLLSEYVVSMPRGAAVVYPKDAAQILTSADIFPGAHVVEAGAGSGSLSAYLLRAVGPTGRCRRTSGAPTSLRSLAETSSSCTAVSTRRGSCRSPTWWRRCPRPPTGTSTGWFLDLLAPWECVDVVADA
jgi:tRNA (adenine57-N1/adenine58-N1)-methyltransferase